MSKQRRIHNFYLSETDSNESTGYLVKQLEEDKEKLIIQLVDYEELKSENKRLKKQIERRT